MQKLHEASEKLGNARKHYEGALNTNSEGSLRGESRPRTRPRMPRIELEKVDEQIKEELKKTQS